MDALEQMREQVRQRAAQAPKGRRKQWTAPTSDQFAHGSILAIDQTLTNCGFAMVTSSYKGLSVTSTGVIVTKTDKKGFEETYDKADQLERLLPELLIGAGVFATGIVMEMPAVAGYRTESSLMAGWLVRQAARQHARGLKVHMVSNTAMKALLCAPGQRHEKKYVRAAVESLIPEANRRGLRRWNEHVHDAVALALTHLYRGEEQP